jgi:hypothetical protein
MAGSRRARLADRRAAALLGALRGTGARVLPAPDGFRVPAADVPPPCIVVIDPSRPETPDDHGARLARMIADCGPEATVALIACGGTTSSTSALAPRGWQAAQATLADAGFTVTLTPFDVLGACSPWRLALGARCERVLTELDDHLASPAVRRAVGLVEQHLVATLPPSQSGRVLVVGTRGATAARAPVSRAAFDAAMATLLHDDAVMRCLAFVDAELLRPGVGLLGWLRAVGSPALMPLLRSRDRWWHEDLEVQRLGEAAAHRLARRAIDELRGHDGGVAETLEYELVAEFNAAIGAWVDEEPPA